MDTTMFPRRLRSRTVPAVLMVLGVGVLVLLGGCSGPSQGSGGGAEAEGGPNAEDTETETARPAIREAETFDVAAYENRAPKQTVEVRHQVPDRLMQGRADQGVEQTLEGFRIQVFSAEEKTVAQEFRERVRQWWEAEKEEAPGDLFRDQPPIEIEYSQPYYRVRFGAFASREEAEKALDFVREEYAGAFLARSTVTVVR